LGHIKEKMQYLVDGLLTWEPEGAEEGEEAIIFS